VEIFFDVVFVFTLTQLTLVLEVDLSLAGIGRVLLIWSTMITAAVVLATVPIGSVGNAGLHLAAVVAVVVAMLLFDTQQRAGATLHQSAR
jgi:hypothetical protein